MLGFWYFACARIPYSEHFSQLLTQYESVDLMWQNLSEQEWCTNTRYSPSWQRISHVRNNLAKYEKMYEDVHKNGIHVLAWETPLYPPLLKEIYAPPLVLFSKGNTSLLNQLPFLAIVGTRRASPYGIWCTEKIVQNLAQHQIHIVSGLAYGIDTAVHQATLKQHIASVIIVPAPLTAATWGGNYQLIAPLLAANHVFLSETMPDEVLAKFHFAKRNRLIAGLSKWTVVVEAPQKSGALITAQYALNENREVWVVPHNIGVETGIGCLDLIEQGAQIITNFDKMPEYLGITSKKIVSSEQRPTFQFSSTIEEQLFYLIHQGKDLEEASHILQIGHDEVLKYLGQLLLKNYITQTSTGAYQTRLTMY